MQRILLLADENTFSEALPWAITCLVLVVILALVLLQSFRTRAKMQRSLDRAEHMESLGRLAGGVAHDFNNMLAGILGASELALDHAEKNPALRHQMGLIHDSASRAAELTQSLLTFSRRNPALLKLVNLHKLLDRVIDLLTRSINRLITVNKSFAASEYNILADTTQMQNVFLNLCVNARDAMPNGGTLNITTRNRVIEPNNRLRFANVPPGKYMEITVSDTGIGMPPHILNHIFEPFFTTKEHTKGSGMGLSSVYGVVQSHHGAIDVSSSPGHGSVFTVFLPVAHSPKTETKRAPAPAPILPPGDPATSASLRILVVDDEPGVCDVTVQILKTLGHHVTGVGSSEEAVQTLRSISASPFDLAIVDLIMPKVSGQDCAQRLRELQPELRVIYTSGFSRSHVEQQIAEEPNTGFIQKPFGRKALAESVNTLMNFPGKPRAGAPSTMQQNHPVL